MAFVCDRFLCLQFSPQISFTLAAATLIANLGQSKHTGMLMMHNFGIELAPFRGTL